MVATPFTKKITEIFKNPININDNFIERKPTTTASNQIQTNDVFSTKWDNFDGIEKKNVAYDFQRRWYLQLYGFPTEEALRQHLANCNVIFDAGCGLGYKAAWFARLAPHALVIGMDFSNSARQASQIYRGINNLYFIQGDIAATGLCDDSVDYVSCDQVIMHTENPEKTFSELCRVTERRMGQLACYFYAKKALPRELLDDFFRSHCKNMTSEELWALSEQLTELGKRLAELRTVFESPEIPALGIKAGQYDIQRFIYWNFIKCFWNEELGRETSVSTNFDWYSPSNARRFSESEVMGILSAARMRKLFFHSEQACYSGRFSHGY